MEELSALMTQYVDVKAKIKALKEEQDGIRTDILLKLKINDLTEFQDEDNMLQFTINTRRSFDKEKAVTFIAENGGVSDEFFLESEYETLKVKTKGGE